MVRASLTPPALPRPPAWICALTTHRSPGMALAASTASSGERATRPAGTAMPYSAKSCFAWYSWKFIWNPCVGGTERGARPARYSRRSDRPGQNAAPHGVAPAALPPGLYSPAGTHRPRRLPSIFAQPAYTQRVLRRELYLFALYRLLEASLLALVVFGPGEALIGEARDATLATATCLAYVPAAILLLVWSRRTDTRMSEVALVGVCTDVIVAALVTHAVPQAVPGVALMLVFNLGAAALFLRLQAGLAVAGFASAALLVQFVWDRLDGRSADRPLAELLMFTFSFFAMVTLTF